MRFLITGGLGFVGSHLTESLIKKNHEVIILTKSFSKKNNIRNSSKKIKIEKIDVTKYLPIFNIMKKYKPDVVIHLAGNTSHSKSFENPIADLDSNTKSTIILLESIRKLKLKTKFILGSTFIVIGKPSKLPINEKTESNPTTIYGANRLTSETYCKIYHEVYGIKTNIFRLTNSFGPREQIIPNKNAVNFLIYSAYKDHKISIFNQGEFFRDFIYIDDVITAINLIIRKGKSGELYWISSGKKIWFKEFAILLKKYTKCKVKFVKSPNYTKKVDVGNFVVSNSKICRLGWKQKFSFEEGIKKTLDFFKTEF
tara:strand:+ start:16132 stop:17067 length:936 start_codon:yes stop_codon:yes gene_type:complete